MICHYLLSNVRAKIQLFFKPANFLDKNLQKIFFMIFLAKLSKKFVALKACKFMTFHDIII